MMKKTTKYYRFKFLERKDEIKVIRALLPKIESAKIFGTFTDTWLIVTGDYDFDSAMHPNEPSEDFEDVLNRCHVSHHSLSSRPQPEKRWIGKWVDAKERLDRIEKLPGESK